MGSIGVHGGSGAAGGGDASAANQVLELAQLTILADSVDAQSEVHIYNIGLDQLAATIDTNSAIRVDLSSVGGLAAAIGVTNPVSAQLSDGAAYYKALTDTQLRASAVPVSNSVLSVVGGGTEATAQRVTIASDSTGVLSVDDNGSTLTVDQATGTNLHMVVDSGTITTVSTVTAVTAITNALPAGTNAIGKLSANSGVDIGDVDVTSLPTAFGKTLTFVPVAQGAAGTTQLAAADATKKHKVMGCILTLSIGGTLKFLDSSGDLTGAMDIAAAGGFVLPTSMLQYMETGAVNRSISITSTTGAAKGVVVLLTEA